MGSGGQTTDDLDKRPTVPYRLAAQNSQRVNEQQPMFVHSTAELTRRCIEGFELLLHDLLLLGKQKQRQTCEDEGAAAHASGGAAEKTASEVDILTVVYPFRCCLFCGTTCCMGSCTYILLSFHTNLPHKQLA